MLFGTYRPEDQIQYMSAPTHPPLQLQARRHLVLKLRHPEARDGDFVVGRKRHFTAGSKPSPTLLRDDQN